MRSPSKTFHIGVVANLNPNGSIHRQTFIQAITRALKYCNVGHKEKVRIVWENDSATQQGGMESAERLVRMGVDVVVGHFASSAAMGALPLYETAGIPLLLPAATANFLTSKFKNAFRVCRNDADLAKFISHKISTAGHLGRLAVAHDDSVHGHSLSTSIREELGLNFHIVDLSDRPSTVVFVGSYQQSIRFLYQYSAHNPLSTIYLTDDAAHPALQQDSIGIEQRVFVFGYAPSWWYPNAGTINAEYFNELGVYPSAYFLETFAAFQIAWASRSCQGQSLLGLLKESTWQTILGDIRFSKGESRCSQFACWQLNPGIGLQPLQISTHAGWRTESDIKH